MNEIVYIGADPGFRMDGVSFVSVLAIKYTDLTSMGEVRRNIVFTSKRGVIALKMSHVEIKSDKIYCIGQVTSRYLNEIYGRTCIIPKRENSEGLAELLCENEKEVHIIASDHVSPKLVSKLRECGVEVLMTTAYELLENRDVDYSPIKESRSILVGSSRSFEIIMEKDSSLIKGKDLYAIGEPTRKTMERYGVEPKATFGTPNIRNILSKIKSEKDLSQE